MNPVRTAIFLTILSISHLVAAQESVPPASASTTLRGDPAPPVAPEVITRDDDGHATVRAIRLAAPLRVDGKLDEEIYQRERPFGGFIQGRSS